MGFQGSLDSVNLGDIFQTLAMNRQNGTLVVQRPNETHCVWFDNGNIALCDGADRDGRPQLLDVLQRRGLLTPKQAQDIEQRLYDTNQPLRDLVIASGLMPLQDLDQICAGCLEDRVCEIFEWNTGTFSFIDGPPIDQLNQLEVIEAGDTRLQTQSVVMEAMRRRDEWGRIKEVIPDPDEMYVVDNDGRINLSGLDTEQDPDMVKVLRYLDGKHTVDIIADQVGLPRFDAFAIVAQLVMARVARPCTPQEVLQDALSLREEGHLGQAADMLEAAARINNLPEVLRPLAELKTELGDTPRAVELYLDLIQRAQDDGDLDQALADLEVVIGVNPDDPDLQIDRAEVLLDLGRNEESAKGFITAATNYLATRDTKLAVDACHRAKDLSPTSPDPHRLLAKAYLMDNQSENAVVEYKSLWHTLLSHSRPRKALDQLEQILNEDCKFQAVKTQILEHARGSEAIKTGSAVRLFVYVLILLLLVGGGYVGWQVYETKIAVEQRREEANAIESELENADLTTNYDDLNNHLRRLKSSNADPGLARQINALIADWEVKYEEAATELRAQLDESMEAGDLTAAEDAITSMQRRFPKTEAAKGLDELAENIADSRARTRIATPLAEIEASWNSDEPDAWTAAIAALAALIERERLTDTVKAEVEARLAKYRKDVINAEFLFRRAEELERKDMLGEAMAVFRKAMAAEGSRYPDEARKRLISLEEGIAANTKANIIEAIKQEDATQLFALLDELKALIGSAEGTRPAKEFETILLPLTLTVDHHRVKLTVNNGQREQVINAPNDATGPWRVDLTYPTNSGLTISAEREGFRDEQVTITAGDRKISAKIAMSRGHLWQVDMRSAPITTPVIGERFVLVGTTDSKLHFVSTESGTDSALPYDPVHSFTHEPFLFRGIAYVGLGGRIHAADAATRARLWSWPEVADIGAPAIGRFGLWVQEHELIPGQHQLFAGAQPPGGLNTGHVVTLAIDQVSLALDPYPETRLDAAVSGPPLVHESVLYLPAGRDLITFDATSVSRSQSLSPLYTFTLRSELKVRPVAAVVDARSAILVADSNGTVIALDADPYAPNQARNLMTWNLPTPVAASPVIAPDARTAYCSLVEGGGLVALNLDRTNERAIRWRFPSEGQIGSIPGAPAIGRNGIYIADANGILYCIDIETGKERWRYDLTSGVSTGIGASAGKVYVGTRNGFLQCFEEGQD